MLCCGQAIDGQTPALMPAGAGAGSSPRLSNVPTPEALASTPEC